MKKILSIFLALTLIIGLIPTAFADDTTPETISVTYNFAQGQHGTSVEKYLENCNGVKTASNYSILGGEWAYLGTTTEQSYSSKRTEFAILQAGNAAVQFSEDSFIAFKIKVSETAKYKVSNYTAYLWKKEAGAQDVKMYIVPISELPEINWGTISSSVEGDVTTYSRSGASTLENLDIKSEALGTLYYYHKIDGYIGEVDVSDFSEITLEKNTEYALIFHSETGKYFGPATLTLTGKPISTPSVQFVIPEDGYETYNGGTVSLDAKLIAADGVTDITADATSVEYESNNTAIATVDANGIVTGVSAGTAVITATYTYAGKTYSESVEVTIKKVEKDKTYYLGTNYMSDAAKDKATEDEKLVNNKLSDISYVDEYAEIADGSWAIAADITKCGITLDGGNLRADAKRESYLTNDEGSILALQLKVAYNGTYKVNLRTDIFTYGTEADVYIIPKTDRLINQEYLKSIAPIGRISAVTPDEEKNGNKIIPTINEAYKLYEGDYYVVLNFNTDNANALKDGIQYLVLRNIQLLESTGTTADTNAPAEKEIEPPTIAITSNLPGAEIKIETLDSVGASYSLNAPEVEGCTFLGWKRGVAEKNGESYIETNGTSKFTDYKQNDIIKVYTNTFLTAVYEKNEPAATENPIIKFWNQDKSFLGAITKDDITTLPVVSLIGHSFKGWFTSPGKALVLADVTVDTNAVANYEENSYLDADNVYDKVRVNGEDVSESKYGEAVVCEDNNGIVTHWLRDGKIVSYDKKYTHYIWDGTVISSSYAPVEKKPLVLLEKTTIDGASMIEYDGAGKQIVEVGILFGEVNSTPVVGSTFDKYVSQRSDNHGQLAAKPINDSYTVARGYMIYKDGGNTYVIYSE